MCLYQHGASDHISNGITFWVWMDALTRFQPYCLLKNKVTSTNFIPSFLTFIYKYHRLETVDIKCNSGRAKVLGTVVCIGGAILLTLYRGVPLFDHSHSQAVTQTMDHAIKLNSTKKTERWTLGSIALVVGTFFWSSWFLLQSTIGKRYPCQYSSTAIMSFFGAIQSAILSFSTNRNLSAWSLNGKIEIMTVLYAVSRPPFQLEWILCKD